MVSFSRLVRADSKASAVENHPSPPPVWLAKSAVAPPRTALPPALAAAAGIAPEALLNDTFHPPPQQILHRLLHELGPGATDPRNMPSLKSALQPFGRPDESATARAVLVLAATTAVASGPDGALPSPPSVEVPTMFQMFRLFAGPDDGRAEPPPQLQQQPAVDKAEWNPEIFVTVVDEISATYGKPQDWPAVIRALDLAELPAVLSPHSLRLIVHIYTMATGRRALPGESLVGRWTHAPAQLAMLNCVLTMPGSVNWETVKPAVDCAPKDVASPFRCVPLIEALVDLNARNLLQAAISTSPDLVLLALTNSAPKTNGSIRQQLLVTLLATQLSAFPKTCTTVKKIWAMNRSVVEVGLQRLWQADPSSLPRILDILQYLGALSDALSSSSSFSVHLTMELAIGAMRRDWLNFGQWLSDRLAESGTPFLTSCIVYMSSTVDVPGYPVALAMPLGATAVMFKCLTNGLPLQSVYADAKASLQRVYDIYVNLNPRLSDLNSGWSDDKYKSLTVGGRNSTSGESASGSSSFGLSPVAVGALDEPEAFSPDVDAEADRQYKRLYTEDMSVDETVDLLRQLRSSPVARNQQIYRCMIHTLFDEYRFLTKYPDRELRITGTLFGALAQFSILTGKDLVLLLNHILKALVSIEPVPKPIGRLAKFGVCALERCVETLSDFPALCEKILVIPRLREVVPDLLSSVAIAQQKGVVSGSCSAPSVIEKDFGAPWITANVVSNSAGSGVSVPPINPGGLAPGRIALSALSSQSPDRAASVRGSGLNTRSANTQASGSDAAVADVVADVVGSGLPSSPSSVSNTPRTSAGIRPSVSTDSGFAAFSSVNMDSLLSAQQQTMEVPDAATQDKIHFIFNNLTVNNLDVKESELMGFLEARHVEFVAHYVVVKRASIEANFHHVYIALLSRIAKHLPGIFSKVFERSFINVRILLNSEKIVSSSSERVLLKSLGSWIGALTLARNKPLLRKELDIKELLLDAYSNGRLIAVVPFVAKLLNMAKDSLVFKASNPWLFAILRLLKEIYLVPDLKLNVKFELPLLAKILGVEANDIEPSDLLSSRKAPARDGNPDFTSIKKNGDSSSPVRSASPVPSPVRLVRDGTSDSFSGGSGVRDGTAIGSSGVPIFSLGGASRNGANGSGLSGGLNSIEEISSVLGGVNGVRASVPGSDTVSDLASILASASLSSQNGQQQSGAINSMHRSHAQSVDRSAAAAVAAQQVAVAAAAAAAASEVPLIPNLAQHIVISSSLRLFQTAPGLKSFIPAAIDRAVREIINPVVERSCAIATITTRELILKDFAYEVDTSKILKSARQMVQQLAGSLALVTCKEPLRVSMGNQLRPPLSAAAAGDSHLLDQTVLVLCTSNLEIGCKIIEHAATEKAAREIPEVIAPVFTTRRQQQQSQQRQGYGIPGSSSPQDVLRVYDDFSRLPRTAAAPQGSAIVDASEQQGVGQASVVTGSAVPAQLGENSIRELPSSMVPSGPSRAQIGIVPSGLVQGFDLGKSVLDGGGKVASLDGGHVDPMAASGGVPPTTAVTAVSLMATPSAMAEAMRAATAQFPSVLSGSGASSAFNFTSSGEDKLLTQQVLELFNGVYPQLTAAIERTAESPSGIDHPSSLPTLTKLPMDHEVQRLRLQIALAVKRSLTADEASMAVAQKVFKRLYEGESNLHRDVHVALLESMRECSRRLSKELVSWLAYSDDAKKLNRECAVALLRPGSLLHITSYDELIAKTCDNGRNSAAVEFAAYLVQRVIIEEPLTTTRELYLTLEVLLKAGQRNQAVKFPFASEGLVALVEECRNVVHRPAPSPSVSSASSSVGANVGVGGLLSTTSVGPGEGHLAATAKAVKATAEAEAVDPAGSKDLVASVLTEWQRVLSTGTTSNPVPDRHIASFVMKVKPTVLYNDEARDRFLRIGIDLVCVATSSGLTSPKNAGLGPVSPIAAAPYTPVEAMVRLVAALCKTETSGENAVRGVAMLTAYLQALVRCILKAMHRGDVRPHFRLFVGMVSELAVGMPPVDTSETGLQPDLDQDGTPPSASGGENGIWNGLEPGLSPERGPDAVSSPSSGGSENAAGSWNVLILTTFANALLACNPNLAPGFAFSWLQVVSNRDLMSRLLGTRTPKNRQLMRQLVVSCLSFLSPHLSKVGPQSELPPAVRTLYRGMMRTMLVLLHDFPEFLCDYHFALCDVIPPTCIQMRNLVLSAYPRNMRLPDPFMPNLKVDKLPEMATEPSMLSNLTTSLVSTGLKGIVDKFLQDTSSPLASSLKLQARLMAKDKTYNIPAINALVLYLGQQSIVRNTPGSPPVIIGPSTDVMRSLLMDLDAEGRYHLVNAIANQLRFPNMHTHYFSCVILFLFRDSSSDAAKEQIARVLVERLIANRPHPWGLLITFIELIKNGEYGFWNHDFVRCAPQVKVLFSNVSKFASRGSPSSESAAHTAGISAAV